MQQQYVLFSQHMFQASYAFPHDLWRRSDEIARANRHGVSWVSHANSYVNTREIFVMPRKHAQPKSVLSEFSFVRCRLSRDEKAAFKKWSDATKLDFHETLDHYLMAGVKISWSFDESNDSFICSFTQKGEISVNANRCMTSRGPDPFVALAVNVYKDRVIYEGGVWEDIDGDEDFG